MALISVTNSSVTIEERPFQDIVKSSILSWLSQFFWCLIFQSLTVSFLKRKFGYFFDAYLLASGLSYFHTWLAVSFFTFSGRTCCFFLCSCFPWRLFSSLAAEIRLSVKAGMGTWRMEWGEWWECGKSWWECRELGWECGECRECAKWGENAGNHGGNAENHCGKIVYKIQFNFFPEIEKIKKNKHSLKSIIFVLSN